MDFLVADKIIAITKNIDRLASIFFSFLTVVISRQSIVCYTNAFEKQDREEEESVASSTFTLEN